MVDVEDFFGRKVTCYRRRAVASSSDPNYVGSLGRALLLLSVYSGCVDTAFMVILMLLAVGLD